MLKAMHTKLFGEQTRLELGGRWRCRGDRDGEEERDGDGERGKDGDGEGDEGRRRYLNEDGDIEIITSLAPLGDSDQI
jgi:hypothetical protein